MANDSTTRLEVKLRPERRRQLDELASAAGCSSAALVRMAIGQLLEQRTVTLPAAEAHS